MKMSKMLSIGILVLAGSLAACGKQEVSFQTLEDAKSTANANALFNAQIFRQSNVLLQDNSIIASGDSSQEPSCPQGDGWATLKFVNANRTLITLVKCSTVSAATGCLLDAEFKRKPYAADDGHCQPPSKVPHPLPKIAK